MPDFPTPPVLPITAMDTYIQAIIDTIYTSQNLCKYLYYDQRNPIFLPDLEPSVLMSGRMNQRIFVTPFNVETTDIAKTTLHILINNFELDQESKYYEHIDVDFIICMNTRLWELNDDSGNTKLRISGIIEELLLLFNRQRITGLLGKNFIDYGKIMKFNDYYWGYSLSFKSLRFASFENTYGA